MSAKTVNISERKDISRINSSRRSNTVKKNPVRRNNMNYSRACDCCDGIGLFVPGISHPATPGIHVQFLMKTTEDAVNHLEGVIIIFL